MHDREIIVRRNYSQIAVNFSKSCFIVIPTSNVFLEHSNEVVTILPERNGPLHNRTSKSVVKAFIVQLVVDSIFRQTTVRLKVELLCVINTNLFFLSLTLMFEMS